MDDKPSTTKSGSKAWIVIVAVIALLLVCIASALVGGAAGYLIGHRAGQAESTAPREYRLQPTPEELVPMPEVPGVPFTWALVVEVVEDSPADRAGLRVGDLIVSVDGESLSNDVSLADLIQAREPGDEVKLTVQRAGRERTITVTLGQDPENGDAPWLGIRYRQVPEGRGMRFEFEMPGMSEQRIPLPGGNQ